jgi:predicted XRE-type DNA-binding protein
MEQHTFETAFHATAKDPAEAARKVARAELMIQIQGIIRQNGWTQAEAARRCGVTQPRINLLLTHRFDKFSLDSLFRIAANLGRRIQITLGDEQEAA